MSVMESVPSTVRPRRRQRLAHVISSELLKARSLRSQWVLWAASVVGGLVGTVAALVFALLLAGLEEEGLPDGEVEALLTRGPTAGAATAAIMLGFAAIHLSASERSTGRERLTDVMVPARGRTFTARLAVVVAGALMLSLLTFVIGWLIVVAMSPAVGLPLEQAFSTMILSVVTAATAVTLVTVFAAAIGLSVRNGVLAAAAFVGIMVVLPAILGTIGATTRNDAYAWVSSMMPAGRLGAVLEASAVGDILGVAVATAALLAWAGGAVAIAWVCWRSADARQGPHGRAAGERA